MIRMDLHRKLCQILECPEEGTKCRAYFQPPASIKMVYPCFVYSLNNIYIDNADNKPYITDNRYNIIAISKDPDSDLPKKILASFEKVRYDRSYKVNNLNHWSFTIY